MSREEVDKKKEEDTKLKNQMDQMAVEFDCGICYMTMH